MEHPQSGRFIGGKLFECSLEIDGIGAVRKGSGVWKLRNGVVVWRGDAKLGESSDDNASCDHGEVGCEGAIAAKTAEGGEIFVDPRQEDFCYEIVAGVSRDLDVARGGRVIYDVDDESEEAVGEFLPSGRVFR